MLTIISPAKSLQFDHQWDAPGTQPAFADAKIPPLLEKMKSLSQADIQSLMSISDKLGALNYDRFQSFDLAHLDQAHANHALHAFQGDVFQSLDINSLPVSARDFAQDHLGILSGLYGLLRPLDWMLPYRLEMGVKLACGESVNLYEYWRTAITQLLAKVLSTHAHPVLLNCASQEYAKVVDKAALGYPMIDCLFQEMKQGKPKTVGILAKRARGMMVRYILENSIDTPEQVKAFDVAGYTWQADLSSDDTWVFCRDAL